jgi:tRNA-modifying protein YgfZ
MTEWISATGGRWLADTRIEFDTPAPARRALEETVVMPLVHLAALDVSGPDAEAFLQGQTSAQVTLADGRFAPLTVFCTPKGRMLANAQLLRLADAHYRLLMHKELVAPLAEHLGKFTAFYRVDLRPRDDLALIGLVGREAPALVETRLDIDAPKAWRQAGDTAWQVLAHPGPRPRLLVCLPAEDACSTWRRLVEQAAPVGNDIWRLQDIQAGLAWLDGSQRDTYLPQMINWEALGGISFKKGCYTGQEVVARAHFRGQVKKRLVRAQLDGGLLPDAGSAIEDGDGKRLGEVLSAALDAYDEAEVLAVMSVREPTPPLYCAGQRLKPLRLPYPIDRLDPESLASGT